ncbi:hypothetical protein EPUL_006429, partial [Erysiphe pulchra]
MAGKHTLTSRREAEDIWKFQREWSTRVRLPHTQIGGIFGLWIQSHKGNRGNELADKLAKEGAERSQIITQYESASFVAIKKLVLEKKKVLLETWWEENAPRRYRDLKIQAEVPGKCPPELLLPRKILHLLISARTGHGDFKSYHKRFHHENYQGCDCGTDKSPEQTNHQNIFSSVGKRGSWPGRILVKENQETLSTGF